jgi:hypothetical protein
MTSLAVSGGGEFSSVASSHAEPGFIEEKAQAE